MNRRYLLIIALCLATQACSFKKDGANVNPRADNNNTDVIETIKKEQEKQAFEGRITEQNVSVKFLELPEPRQYNMVITWPEQVSRMQVTVNGKTVIYNSQLGTNSHQQIVFSEKTQEIELLALDSFGAPVSSLSITRTAPLDFVVPETLNLTSDTLLDVERLFLYRSSQIIANGHNLSIIAKKVIVESNESSASTLDTYHIITRLPDSRIESTIDKRQSSITIQADKAIGHLKVALVGANGKDGRSGEELERVKGIQKVSVQLNGPTGADGILAWTTKSCPKRTSLDGPPCEKEVPLCQRPPTNGGDGLQGEAGHDGENGEDGGPTGNLTTLVKDHSSFSLEVIQMPGKPGKGGQGASGHPGGRGGDPGKNPGSPCTNAKRGSDGPKGANGANGKDGKPGLIGEVLHNVERIKIIQL